MAISLKHHEFYCNFEIETFYIDCCILIQGGPKTDAEKIQDEVQRQVAKCTCVHRFKVYQVGEGKYRVSNVFILDNIFN